MPKRLSNQRKRKSKSGVLKPVAKFKAWIFPKLKKKRPSYLNIHWINEKIITVENKVNVLEVKWRTEGTSQNKTELQKWNS